MTPSGWMCPHCNSLQGSRTDRCGWCEDEVEMKPLWDRDVVLQAAIDASSADITEVVAHAENVVAILLGEKEP